MSDQRQIKFGSVCSGVSAASMSWNASIGWKAAWFHEIESFPSSVLAQRYPYAKNWGDMRAAPDRIRSGEMSAPDVLCGGTPCQAFSLAGARRSLDDARGNLSLTFCEIANEIDDRRIASGDEPCVVFWENVLGVLGTHDNAFGCFLAGLAGDDEPLEPGPRPEQGRSSLYWSWNKKSGQHDAKWPDAGIAVGPRRTVAWRVLDAQHFELAQRRKRVFVVASAREGFDPGAVLFESEGVRRDSAPSRQPQEEAARLAGSGVAYGGGNCSGGIDVSACLTAAGQRIDFEVETFVVTTAKSVATGAVCVTGDITHTLTAEGFDASEDGTGRGQPIVPHIAPGYSLRVRRLMPSECERLQGFDELHTAVTHRGKPAADGPRYKAIGNSWAVNCTRWIGQRIQHELDRIGNKTITEISPMKIHECEVIRTDNYVETLSVRRVEAMEDLFEVRIESQLLTAKNPAERHLKKQLLVTGAAAAAAAQTLLSALNEQRLSLVD